MARSYLTPGASGTGGAAARVRGRPGAVVIPITIRQANDSSVSCVHSAARTLSSIMVSRTGAAPASVPELLPLIRFGSTGSLVPSSSPLRIRKSGRSCARRDTSAAPRSPIRCQIRSVRGRSRVTVRSRCRRGFASALRWEMGLIWPCQPMPVKVNPSTQPRPPPAHSSVTSARRAHVPAWTEFRPGGRFSVTRTAEISFLSSSCRCP